MQQGLGCTALTNAPCCYQEPVLLLLKETVNIDDIAFLPSPRIPSPVVWRLFAHNLHPSIDNHLLHLRRLLVLRLSLMAGGARPLFASVFMAGHCVQDRIS